MNTMGLYDRVCTKASDQVVRHYSTSFRIGIRLLHRRFRAPIKGIYGFVRFADEITDTFHGHDKQALLARFGEDAYRAIEEGISLNPVLHSFQRVANTYGIGRTLIEPFLHSMAMDLDRSVHDAESYASYLAGSAESVGLMCLRVFCEGDEATFQRLSPAAMRLGAAFQKVNFLRDLHEDHAVLGRTYFPGLDVPALDNAMKQRAEQEIERDFQAALDGIRNLPKGSRFGVYTAYIYYWALLRKIQGLPAARIQKERIRIGPATKLHLLTTGFLKHSLGLL